MVAESRKTAGDQAKAAAGKVREGAEKAREAFQERVIDPAKRAGEAMKASGEKVVEHNKNVGLKMLDQAESNAREAFAAMRAAAGAKDLSEVMKIQGEFLREQSNRSMTQAREIGELIMQFGRDAVSAAKGGGKKG